MSCTASSIYVCVCVCWLQGRFTIAAKHHITIAEIYESELVDIEKVKWGVKGLLPFLWDEKILVLCATLWMSSSVCFQAIAHYEQAADYYKGEESNR